VPWCDDCSQWFSPNALAPDGTCPRCGRAVGKPGPADRLMDDDVAPKVPWHFWLLVVALVIYLGWRLVQGIGLLID
jgi:hypothetical protein